MLAFALAWWIGTFFLIIFQCHPVEAFWDVLAVLAGQCIPTGVLIFGFELSNVFVDLLIIALPLNEIRKLQMPLQRKLALTSVFGLGGLSVPRPAPARPSPARADLSQRRHHQHRPHGRSVPRKRRQHVQ